MTPAAFNSIASLPEHMELADRVHAWLLTVAPAPMPNIAARFRVTTAAMRPIVESLIAQRRVSQSSGYKRTLYGSYKEPVVPVVAIHRGEYQFPTVMLDRYAQLKADRAALPSKFY